MMYSEEERDEQIKKMRAVSDRFYSGAVHTNVHAFIEFCGFMNKFIDICRESSKAGVDFNESNTHTGSSLTVKSHDVEYLAEKFDCIFGPTLEDPELRKVFLKKLGW